MIVSLLEKIPYLIAGIFLAIAAVRILRGSKNMSKSDVGQIFKSAKYICAWVLIATVLLTGVFTVFNHMGLKNSVHAIISLNYSEASQALNSNGTRYNMAEIISDEVVEKAIKKGALPDVSVKELKECLTVYPCVQGGVADKSQYLISTEFAVEYHASKHTDHLNTDNVIKLITSAYKEYYIEKYTDNFRLEKEGEKPDFQTMEYMDIVSYLEKETNAVLTYLYGMAEKSPSFVTNNETTFNAIAGKVYQFKETQINENLKSLILQNGIARDKARYTGRLTHQNKNTDFDRQKNAVSFDLCNQAIGRYAEEMTRIVLVPTWDQSGKYYMGRTKVGVDELSVQATNFSDNVASNEKEIMDNNLIIAKMNASQADEAAYAAADELINSIYNSLKAFEKEAVTAGREYSSYRMNQCIAVAIYGISVMGELKSIIMFMAIAYCSFMLFEISKKFQR